MFPFLQMSHADRRWFEKYVQAERSGSGDFSSGEMTSRQARIGLANRVLQRSTSLPHPNERSLALIGPHIPGGNNMAIIADEAQFWQEDGCRSLG